MWEHYLQTQDLFEDLRYNSELYSDYSNHTLKYIMYIDNLALNYDIVFARKGDKITEITLDNMRRFKKKNRN